MNDGTENKGLRQIVFDTPSCGKITALISENSDAVKDRVHKNFHLNEEIQKQLDSYNQRGISYRGLVYFNEQENISAQEFLQREKRYAGDDNSYFTENFRYGFLKLNDTTVLFLEDTNKGQSLVGNLQDHIESTIQSICY